MSNFLKYMYLGSDASIFDEMPDGDAPVTKKPQEGAMFQVKNPFLMRKAELTEDSRRQEGGTHYQLPIQPIDYIVQNKLGYREGNVVKYVTRHLTKNGKEDIKKAIHYLEMILEDYDAV